MGKTMFLALCLVLAEATALASVMMPTLIGGRYALEGEFPETLYISNGSARCSASLIGPKVLLTAGHCSKDNGEITPVSQAADAYTFVDAQVVYKATCTISDKYESENHDMALCLLNKEMPIKPASVVAKGAGPKMGDAITHVGYGCVTPRNPDRSGGTGGNDGRLKVGEAKVTSLAEATDYFFVTFGDGLCFGDSGGPAYKKLTNPKSEPHVVLGVNSQANIKDTNYLTDLAMEQSYVFMNAWAKKNQAAICGVTKDCGKPTPPAPECLAEKKEVDLYQGKLDKAKAVLEVCLKSKTDSDGQAVMRLPYIE